MEKKEEYVLVLGSKPEYKIPKINFRYIYAANGSIERIQNYKNFYDNFRLISILSGLEFSKNLEVQKRVSSFPPDEIICRLGNINLNNFNALKNLPYKYLSNLKQLSIQSKFIKYGIMKILLSETFYEDEILKKIKHLFHSIRWGSLVGVSTGFFSILYALKQHPTKKIFIAGIGMTGKGHMYNNLNRYNKRSIVDRKLILSLKKIYKSKLLTTDLELSEHSGIEYFKID